MNGTQLKQMVIEFLEGKLSNNEIIKKYGVKNVVKYYNLIRQQLFATAKDFPKEIITLVKKSKREIRSTSECKVDKNKISIKMIKAVLEGQSLLQFSKDNKLSNAMVNKIFWSVAEEAISYSDVFVSYTPRQLVNAYRKEFKTWLKSKQ